MDLQQRIAAFSSLGEKLSRDLQHFDPQVPDTDSELWLLIRKAYQKNAWFTPDNIYKSLAAVSGWLNKESLEKWTSAYHFMETDCRVGVIMAGNIPMVGFHDFLCVLLSGNSIDMKCSSDDDILLPALISWLIEIEPGFRQKIRLVSKLEQPGAVIATGSNNSARHFEYYFGKYPHIIRKNRNSVAVINGSETNEELNGLAEDVFSYFGLGCRNVSKIYIPHGYDLDRIFKAFASRADIMKHNKYMNNYDYHHALFLLNNAAFLTNNFIILREHEALSTPVAVLHYEYYNSKAELNSELERRKEEIQCIAGHDYLPFGTTQKPGLTDYADGVDVMKFLSEII